MNIITIRCYILILVLLANIGCQDMQAKPDPRPHTIKCKVYIDTFGVEYQSDECEYK